jgi:hypothetical protein
MKLEDIISISGKPGLFEVKAKAKNRIIAESLTDRKKIPVLALNTITSLNEISVYTLEGDIPLGMIFKTMHEKKEEVAIIAEKASADELKAYFKKIVPNFNQERVYVSNIKKIVQWFSFLEENNFDFSKIEIESEVEEKEENV